LEKGRVAERRAVGVPHVVHQWRLLEARLDSLGAQGWELVAATMYSDTPTLYFKRQLP